MKFDKLAIEEWIKNKGFSLQDGYTFITIRKVGEPFPFYSSMQIASVALNQFPGNCGIVVAHHAEGTGPYLAACLELAKLKAKRRKQGMLIYSVAARQKHIISVLKSLNFKEGDWVTNSRHNSKICIFSFNLNQITLK